MKTIANLFSKLTGYHHFLVFLIILTIMKIVNVFVVKGVDEGLHFTQLGVGLIVISSVLHLVFSKFFDKNKTYLNSLISTFLIILMLSHDDPRPVRGVLVILLLYVSKFLVKYKRQNIFNPVGFTIGVVTLLSLIIPGLGVPPMDFTGIDIRFDILGVSVPLPIIPIILALLFNTKRVRKQPLAISYILSALFFGYFLGEYEANAVSYILITTFIGAAVIIEPKTSPFVTKEQIVYGVFSAFVISVLHYWGVPNSLAVGLLGLNILYFLRKNNVVKLI